MIVLTDTIALDASQFEQGKLRRTSDGYAVMDCAVARTGIQEYLAAEMGDAFKDRDPSSVVRVYRPPEVIFSDTSLRSYAHKPLTNDHPPQGVSASNWKQVSIGWTGDEAYQDTDKRRVRVPMLMADADAIADVEAGKVEWSAGYSVSFDIASGTTPDGQAYDAIVTGQKINHIALVDRGRAGPECRIGDKSSASGDALHKDRHMPHTMIIDGLQVPDVSDAAKAAIEKLQGQTVALAADLATVTTARDTLQGEKVVLEQKLKDAEVTPAKLQVLADARAKVIADAKRVAPEIVCDGKTDAEIRKMAVVAKLGDAASALSDAAIEGAFMAMVPVADADADPIRQIVKDGGLKVSDAKAEFQAAREKRLAEMRGETVQ